METKNKKHFRKYEDQIQQFVKLVFEKSEDYFLILNIVKNIGVNSIFPCTILWYSEDETELHQTEYDEMSFLFIALFYENENIIQLLLENGADPNIRDAFGAPAIWDLQFEYDNPEYGLHTTRLLLEHGADPNIEWEGEIFYYYVDTLPADIISSREEFNYLTDLCSLLEEFGGKY